MLYTGPSISWDVVKLSARPLRHGHEILVDAQIKAERPRSDGYGQYRVYFELNKSLGLVTYDVELLVTSQETGEPRWVYSTRRDLALALRDHFLRTQLYAHLAREAGWVPQ